MHLCTLFFALLNLCYGIVQTQLPSRSVYFNKFCPQLSSFSFPMGVSMSSPFAFTKGQRLKCQLQSLFIVASLHNHSADKSTLSNDTPLPHLLPIFTCLIWFLLTFYCYHSFSAYLKQQNIIYRQLSRDDTLKIPKYDDAGSDCSPAGKIFVQNQSENDKLLLEVCLSYLHFSIIRQRLLSTFCQNFEFHPQNISP